MWFLKLIFIVINVKYLNIGTPKLNSVFFSVLNYGVANSVGPDETAPLIWVRNICSELFITIITFLGNSFQ